MSDPRPSFRDLNNLERDISEIKDALQSLNDKIDTMLLHPDSGVYARIKQLDERQKDAAGQQAALSKKLGYVIAALVALAGAVGPDAYRAVVSALGLAG